MPHNFDKADKIAAAMVGKADERPKQAFILHPTMTGQVVLVKRGEPGFWPIKRCQAPEEAATLARTLNRAEGLKLTPALAEAMVVGSMFGWDVPGAFPEAYGSSASGGVMHPEAEPAFPPFIAPAKMCQGCKQPLATCICKKA